MYNRSGLYEFPKSNMTEEKERSFTYSDMPTPPLPAPSQRVIYCEFVPGSEVACISRELDDSADRSSGITEAVILVNRHTLAKSPEVPRAW